MISMKGRKVTLTGKDAKDLAKAAKLYGQTPRQFLIQTLEQYCAAAINGANTTNSGTTQTITVNAGKRKKK